MGVREPITDSAGSGTRPRPVSAPAAIATAAAASCGRRVLRATRYARPTRDGRESLEAGSVPQNAGRGSPKGPRSGDPNSPPSETAQCCCERRPDHPARDPARDRARPADRDRRTAWVHGESSRPRIIDRATSRQKWAALDEKALQPAPNRNCRLERRRRPTSWSINLCTSAALLVCIVIATLFSRFFRADLHGLAGALFVGVMVALVAGLVLLARSLPRDPFDSH